MRYYDLHELPRTCAFSLARSVTFDIGYCLIPYYHSCYYRLPPFEHLGKKRIRPLSILNYPVSRNQLRRTPSSLYILLLYLLNSEGLACSRLLTASRSGPPPLDDISQAKPFNPVLSVHPSTVLPIDGSRIDSCALSTSSSLQEETKVRNSLPTPTCWFCCYLE